MATLEIEEPKGDKTEIIKDDPKMAGNDITKLIILCVVITCAVSLVALVLSIVGVARNGTNQFYVNSNGDGGSSGGNSNDDKIWTFQIGHFVSNIQYLDETTGTIRGYDVDIVNTVCQIANKNCRLVWDLYERCWDGQPGQRPRGGTGLMANWYDTCVGWYQTLERTRTFAFSNPFANGVKSALYVRASASFTWPNFNGLKVGFVDGWWIDEHCLARYNPTGFNQNDVNQVIHYQTEDAAVNALSTGEINVAFMHDTVLTMFSDIKIVYMPENDLCANGGPSLMMRKDQTELISWWNPALDQLIATEQYKDICRDVGIAHGDQPGDNPEDICLVDL